MSWAVIVNLVLGECYIAILMISQRRLKHCICAEKWPVIWRHQSITWAYFNLDLCRHMSQLDHNEFMASADKEV